MVPVVRVSGVVAVPSRVVSIGMHPFWLRVHTVTANNSLSDA